MAQDDLIGPSGKSRANAVIKLVSFTGHAQRTVLTDDGIMVKNGPLAELVVATPDGNGFPLTFWDPESSIREHFFAIPIASARSCAFWMGIGISILGLAVEILLDMRS